MRAITAKAARNSRAKTSVSLTWAAVATHATGTPSPSTATLYFVPRLARSVGLGRGRPPPLLARTEQLPRIRSGWPRSMPPSGACPWPSPPVSAQRVSHRRRGEPLAWSRVALRLRQGVPSRRKRRKVASTRTVSVGGWPGPCSRGGSQTSITVAIRRKILTSKAISYVWRTRHRDRHHGRSVTSQSVVVVKTASKEVVVQEPEIDYGTLARGYAFAGHEMPLRSIRLLTTSATVIGDPELTPSWLMTAPGAPLMFKVLATDIEGNTIEFALPLMFVPASALGTQMMLGAFNNFRNPPPEIGAKAHTIDLGDQELAFAPK